MPWQEVSTVTLREEFVALAQLQQANLRQGDRYVENIQ